jgi:response regulator RpfG family c-di-GMP phosphodiesterase
MKKEEKTMKNETVLLVDDEANVLSSLSRTLLEEDYNDITTAQNGQEALKIMNKLPGLAVVVSDYNMPGMNGIDFLVQVRNLSPDTSRVLLTGVADLEMAIDAVNRGNIFRFLVKPCPSNVFVEAVKDGIRYNQLITGERELLSQTLNGSVKVMTDILALQNPSIFTQTNRLRKLAHDLTIAMNIEEQSWEIELAALLCQIGAVTIPRDILDKWQSGVGLKEPEADMIRTIPRMGFQLIKSIPRLERIAEAVGFQNCTYGDKKNSDSPVGEAIPSIARILKIIIDFDRIRLKKHSPTATMQTMLTLHKSEYDPVILQIFFSKVLRIDEFLSDKMTKHSLAEKQINVEELRIGMVITRDVNDRNDVLIVSAGTTITEVLMYKMINYFRSQAIITPIYIESIF